jgi:hypothetical protein
LQIPATSSVPAEAVFSFASQIITKRRNRLCGETVRTHRLSSELCIQLCCPLAPTLHDAPLQSPDDAPPRPPDNLRPRPPDNVGFYRRRGFWWRRGGGSSGICGSREIIISRDLELVDDYHDFLDRIRRDQVVVNPHDLSIWLSKVWLSHYRLLFNCVLFFLSLLTLHKVTMFTHSSHSTPTPSRITASTAGGKQDAQMMRPTIWTP